MATRLLAGWPCLAIHEDKKGFKDCQEASYCKRPQHSARFFFFYEVGRTDLSFLFKTEERSPVQDPGVTGSGNGQQA